MRSIIVLAITDIHYKVPTHFYKEISILSNSLKYIYIYIYMQFAWIICLWQYLTFPLKLDI